MRFGATSARESRYYSGAAEDLTDYFGPPDLDQSPAAQAPFSGIRVPRGAVALRFDDGVAGDYSAVFPLLRDRHLVAGFALNTARMGTGGYLSYANALEMQGRGMEMMHHTRTHFSGQVDLATFTDETVTAAQELRDQKLFVHNFVQQGGATGEQYFDTPAKMNNVYGRLLRANFAAVEAYLPDVPTVGNIKPLPASNRYGVNHVTGENMTLTQLQARVDNASKYGGGFVEILFHTARIGQVGYISLADFTTFLTYLQTARNNGLVDVLTPTGMLYAQRGDRQNLLYDSGFSEQATGAYKGWFSGAGGIGSAGSPVVSANGEKYVLNAAGAAVLSNSIDVTFTANVEQWVRAENHRSLWFKGRAKAVGSAGTARVVIRAINGGASTNNVNISFTQALTADTWTDVQFMVGNHPDSTHIATWLYHSNTGAATIRWDEANLYKV